MRALFPFRLRSSLALILLLLLPGALLPGVASAQTVSISGPILSNTVWGDDETVVVLPNPVFVANGATLTLLPGVIVRGEPVTSPGDPPGALVITQGSRILADGMAAHPIIFASAAVDNNGNGVPDDTDNDSFPDPWQPGDLFLDDDPTKGPAPETGLWLGLFVLGKAPTAGDCPGFEQGIVHALLFLQPPIKYVSFGGTDPSDDSGILRHVRVRSTSAAEACCEGLLTAGGVTLAGVGDGTVFERNGLVSACVRGFADLHAHPMSHLAFGHRDAPGSCTEIEGIFHGLPGGSLDLGDPDLGIVDDLAACSPETHSDCANPSAVQRITRQTILRVLENRFPNHGPKGAPEFGYWPHAQSRTHQQMHVKWLREAYEGGMRVMIASVTDSEVLEKWYHYAPPGPDCDVFSPDPAFLYQSALEQIQAIEQLVAHNSAWLHLAETPEDAIDAAFPLAGPGKLVLILGLELDALSLADTLDLVDNHRVRSVIPIHLVNNAFGGAAVYDDLFNTLNHWQEGDYFQLVNDPRLSFQLGAAQHLNAYQPIPLPGGLCAIEPRRELEVNPGFAYTLATCSGDPEAGQRNARGISDFDGLFALMQRGVLLDLTHMGWASKSDSLQYAEDIRNISPWPGYPVIDSHTGLHDDTLPPDPEAAVSERDLTWVHARRIQKLGGVIGFGTVGDPPREKIVAGPGRHEPEREIGHELLVRLTGEGRETIAYPAPSEERDDDDALHQLKVRLRTGGDNLEGGSTARLLLVSGANVHEFALKDPGPTWDDYSIHSMTIDQTVGGTPLAALGLKITDVDGVGVRLAGSDDWNVDRLDVLYVGVDDVGAPTGGLLVERFGTPWVRLNGPLDELVTPPQDWRPRIGAFADFVVESLAIEWQIDKSGPLDPDHVLVLNLHDGSKREISMSALDGLVGDPDDTGLSTGTWNLVAGGAAPVRYGDIATLVAFATGRSSISGHTVEVRRVDVRFDGCTNPSCTTPVSDVPMIDGSDPTARGDEPFLIRDDRQTALLWRGVPPPPPIDRATTLMTSLEHLGVLLEVGADGLEFGQQLFLDLELTDGRRFELPVTTTESFGLASGAQVYVILHLPVEDVLIGDVVSVALRAPGFLGGVSGDNLDVQKLDVFRLGDPMGKWLAGFVEANRVMTGDPYDPMSPYEGGFVALGTDFNGLSPQMAYVDRVPGPDQGTPLELPGPYDGMVPRDDTTLARTFTLEEDGLVHYGLLKDFAEELTLRDPVAADALYQSAPRTLEAWKRASDVAASLAGLTAPPGVMTGACGLPACSDGTDNDGDGEVDFPTDLECPDADGVTELPEPGVLALLAGLLLLQQLARRRRQR